jgi:hypothetical protein
MFEGIKRKVGKGGSFYPPPFILCDLGELHVTDPISVELLAKATELDWIRSGSGEAIKGSLVDTIVEVLASVFVGHQKRALVLIVGQ